MAVTTTGSTLLTLRPGLTRSLNVGQVAGSIYGLPDMILTTGGPDGVVTSVAVSGLAYDVKNLEFYMATVKGGSTWIHVVSGT